ncbi:RNA polymerase sigma factor [Brevifollis gellanilyticus]|uniref:RNA polymerase subunit sigma-24 n=1 Tax=Brevifollis gellanilyticus TaxID=748831 RepID=A0A512M7Q6_9BACT|nr:sigma-70 family RNA polymerase sigma factor [Brevifollis gellanilyticus]GEP42767.1 RNA polymerase subunit sigma-24 [Brevifollis gellanilyticus]
MSPTTDHSFDTTRWSLVSQLRAGGDEAAAQVALGELCQRCWFPIYAFVRRVGLSAADAEDATQGFFQHLLTHELMSQARRERGRFRSYLLGCLKHFLGNEWQKRNALRRGGHLAAVHLDALEAEERYRLEVEAMSTSDEEVFDQSWAHSMLDRAMQQLRAEQRDDARFDLLAPALTGSEDRAALMQSTGMNEGALKVTIHRLRKRYRELLRAAVAETVESEAEVDAELAYLVACLRR